MLPSSGYTRLNTVKKFVKISSRAWWHTRARATWNSALQRASKQNKKKILNFKKRGGGYSRETKVFTIPTLLKENTGNGFDHFEFYQRKEPTSQSADFPRSISVEHNYVSKLHVFMWLVVLTMSEVTHTLLEWMMETNSYLVDRLKL